MECHPRGRGGVFAEARGAGAALPSAGARPGDRHPLADGAHGQLPDSEAAWREASFLAGSPDDIGGTLMKWKEAGLQRVLLQMLDQEDLSALESFARHVQ